MFDIVSKALRLAQAPLAAVFTPSRHMSCNKQCRCPLVSNSVHSRKECNEGVQPLPIPVWASRPMLQRLCSSLPQPLMPRM